MKKFGMILLTVCLVVFGMGMAANSEKEANASKGPSEIQTDFAPQKLSALEKKFIMTGKVHPVPHGPQVPLTKAAEWLLENSVKLNGWSLSGYSKFKLDEEYRPSRWHFGLIGGEMDVNTIMDLTHRKVGGSDYWTEWDLRRSRGAVVGVTYTKRF